MKITQTDYVTKELYKQMDLLEDNPHIQINYDTKNRLHIYYQQDKCSRVNSLSLTLDQAKILLKLIEESSVASILHDFVLRGTLIDSSVLPEPFRVIYEA